MDFRQTFAEFAWRPVSFLGPRRKHDERRPGCKVQVRGNEGLTSLAPSSRPRLQITS